MATGSATLPGFWMATGWAATQFELFDGIDRLSALPLIQCFSGYLLTNPSRFGIFTFGKVSAFMTSFSPMILLSAKM
jgi:hypothetical protein